MFFSTTCSFCHKFEQTNKFERNTFIKSHLEIVYENNKLEEICNYHDYGRSDNLYIQYSLKNNLIRSIKPYDKPILYSKNQIVKAKRGLPSMAKGAALRRLSRRGSWVQIPPPALSLTKLVFGLLWRKRRYIWRYTCHDTTHKFI